MDHNCRAVIYNCNLQDQFWTTNDGRYLYCRRYHLPLFVGPSLKIPFMTTWRRPDLMWLLLPHIHGELSNGASGHALQHTWSWGCHDIRQLSQRTFSAMVAIIGIPGIRGLCVFCHFSGKFKCHDDMKKARSDVVIRASLPWPKNKRSVWRRSTTYMMLGSPLCATKKSLAF